MYLTSSATPVSSTMPPHRQAREGIDALKCVIGFSRAAMPDQGWTDKVLVAYEEYVVVRAVRESTSGVVPGLRHAAGCHHGS